MNKAVVVVVNKAVVEHLGFAADRMVSDVCMLVPKTNKISQSCKMLAHCFQVRGQCGKLW